MLASLTPIGEQPTEEGVKRGARRPADPAGVRENSPGSSKSAVAEGVGRAATTPGEQRKNSTGALKVRDRNLPNLNPTSSKFLKSPVRNQRASAVFRGVLRVLSAVQGTSLPLLCIVPTFTLAGCQQTKPTATTAPKPAQTAPQPPTSPVRHYTVKEMSGAYHGEVAFGDKVPMNVRAALSKQIEANVTTLKPDGTFAMGDGRQKIEGVWSIQGNSIILNRKKINGQTVDQFVASLVKAHASPRTIQAQRSTEGRLDIAADGKSLVSPTPSNQMIVMLVRKD